MRLTEQTRRALTAMLAEPDREWYGRELVEITGISGGVLHPMLARLRTHGYLADRMESVEEQPGGRPARRYYRFTPSGRELAERVAVPLEESLGWVDRMRPRDGQSTYLHIASVLRDAIRMGIYPPGTQLPTRVALARHFGVAPMTAMAAVRVLCDEGLVEIHPSVGVFVCVERKRDVAAEVDALAARVAALEQVLRDHGVTAGLMSGDG